MGGGQYEVNIQGYFLTLVYCLMQAVYGDWVHVNNGNHLTRGTVDDRRWLVWWWDITFLPLRWCNAPGGKVCQRYFCTLAAELSRVQERRCNSDRFIVFHMVRLNHAHHMLGMQEILQHLLRWLDVCEYV